ncbi:hypothetical protein [Hymenobacter sp. PAMC 26628]|uniref:hypothetical protein n=1 Tax=Hymenobacter sp. PAMC 26628 TaxID=1484118 RepID=UPI0012FF7303|nr:hypothetical protein [Hymenobacter sp. PAMC 26628]
MPPRLMDPSSFQIFMDALLNRMEQQEARAATTNELLLQVVQEQRHARQDNQKFQQQQSVFNQRLLEWTDRQEKFNERQEKFNERQEKFNERQEKFNERQDQFNIIFLDEIRDIKADVRGLKQEVRTLLDVTIKQHDERLKRLEEFMDGFLRKAG